MASLPNIDEVLVTWGDRLFYPGNRRVRGTDAVRLRAAAIRRRIEATVVPRAPQVMVKVTGGGRGMKAIAAHFRYISKHGRLEIEDQRGETLRGKDSVRDLANEWKFSGSLISDDAEPGHRREAFNIMLSMPRGTDPLCVHRAAREFAKAELDGHKYVMVLHDHQANPHVHLSVRAESRSGRRLNPRKADLQRWRATFAEKLRGYGIEAEATRQPDGSLSRTYEPLWRLKARADGRLRSSATGHSPRPEVRVSKSEANAAWEQISRALLASPDAEDHALARAIDRFTKNREMRAPSPESSERSAGFLPGSGERMRDR